MDEPENERPISPARLSKTPSWITLGFVLGALFVLALPDGDKTAPPATAVPPEQTVKLERPQLSEIEAVFADWGEAAVWQNDLTEVALWDRERRSYSLFYEVLRYGDRFYFRSIPRLTRPILAEGVPVNSPLQYTTSADVFEPRRKTRPEISPPPAEARPPVLQSLPTDKRTE